MPDQPASDDWAWDLPPSRPHRLDAADGLWSRRTTSAAR